LYIMQRISILMVFKFLYITGWYVYIGT